MEEKVYVSWAFSENENEKMKINHKIYEDLNKKYKISYNSKDNQDEFDLIISRTPAHHHSLHRIIKNSTSLSRDELALVCDRGNLCFGYTMEGQQFYIFED